jgi:hypothetical protein
LRSVRWPAVTRPPSEEIAELDIQLDRLVAEAAPELLALLAAVGTYHAATLLIVALKTIPRG